MKKLLKFGAGLMTAAMLATSASAISLQTLVDTDGTLTIGDKTFSNFDYLAVGLSGFDATTIQVTASVVGDVYYLTWGGQIALATTGFGLADLKLNYTVTASVQPGIIMIDQSYTGSAQGNGAFLAVDESVYAGQVIVANSHLEAFDLSDPFAEVGDDLIVDPPQMTLDVTKDIQFGIVDGGLVTISEIKQSFHQVPDGGSSLLLLGLGLLGLAGIRRKA